MSTITFMTVTLNEARHIPRLKASIDALRHPDTITVKTLLIDGGSTDGTADTARNCGFDTVLIEPGASIPVCRNIALRHADTEWMAFIDGDCELRADWLERALPFMNSEAASVYGWPVEPPSPMTWVQRAWHIHWSHKNPHRETVEGREVVRKEAFRLITTRNMLFNRSLARAVDGFDENLPTGEDTDFVFRAYAAGLRVWALPELRVVHHGEPRTLAAFFKQQLWHANRNAYKKIAAKSGGRFGANAPLFTIVFGLSLLFALVSLVCALLLQNPLWILGLLPWLGTASIPANFTALRAGEPRAAPLLSVLYMTYGFARLTDLMGLQRLKKSWKSQR